MSETPLKLALDLLEDAHARYIRASRLHVAELMELGLSEAAAEQMLEPIDLTEALQDQVVEQLRALA